MTLTLLEPKIHTFFSVFSKKRDTPCPVTIGSSNQTAATSGQCNGLWFLLWALFTSPANYWLAPGPFCMSHSSKELPYDLLLPLTNFFLPSFICRKASYLVFSNKKKRICAGLKCLDIKSRLISIFILILIILNWIF